MNEQELQQAFIQFLAQKTGAKSQQELEAAIQQLGEEGLKQAYAEFMLLMQLQQVQAAKFGAKLNYIKSLRGQCPDGYEAKFLKKGGTVCKECVKKQQEVENTPSNPIDAFKCGRKIKKAEKGTSVPQDKYTSRKTVGEEVLAGSPTSWWDKPAEELLDGSGNPYMRRVIPNPGDTVYVWPNWVDKNDSRYPIYRNEFNKNWKEPKKPTQKKK